MGTVLINVIMAGDIVGDSRTNAYALARVPPNGVFRHLLEYMSQRPKRVGGLDGDAPRGAIGKGYCP